MNSVRNNRLQVGFFFCCLVEKFKATQADDMTHTTRTHTRTHRDSTFFGIYYTAASHVLKVSSFSGREARINYCTEMRSSLEQHSETSFI